jgi:ribosomal protein S18 acetylase RimI-like enzyme
MTSYLVRPATRRDARAVEDLSRRVRRELRTGRVGAAPATSGHELSWVVEAGRGEIVGCCAVADRGDGRWQLPSLYLAPEWRGFGLGRALVENALRTVQQHGGLELAVEVPAEAEAAIRLLLQLGFREQDGPEAVESAVRRLVRDLARTS